MKAKQLSLFGDEELIPVPECMPLALEMYGTPARFAQAYVSAARRLMRKNPGKDVCEVITPEWRNYIMQNL